jgi:hypothetical protein
VAGIVIGQPIDLRKQTEILEYDPGDLVVRAQAGTTVASLRRQLLSHHQAPREGVTLGAFAGVRAHRGRHHLQQFRHQTLMLQLRWVCGACRDAKVPLPQGKLVIAEATGSATEGHL